MAGAPVKVGDIVKISVNDDRDSKPTLTWVVIDIMEQRARINAKSALLGIAITVLLPF